MRKCIVGILIASLILAMCGCAAKNETPSVQESEQIVQTEDVKEAKEVIVYFPNWNLDSKSGDRSGEVAGIPWDSVTFINHAFFRVEIADGTTESTFEWRAAGNEPRTEFCIASTDPYSDFEDTTPSSVDPSMARNHFSEYAVYSEKYPEVNILISVGGWTDCGYFSEMAYTEAGRTSFINSCIALMEEYPFIDGIDLDWEYPGGSNDGERLPEGEGDEGCPIWGGKTEDTENFAKLCKGLREAMNEKFGEGTKYLTACSSASTGWTLPNQNWVIAEPYLDYINAMTYDMAGTWDGITGHCTSLTAVKGIYNYFSERDIPLEKVNMGTILYSTNFYIKGDISLAHLVGAEIDTDKQIPAGTISMEELKQFEKEAVSGYAVQYDEDGRSVKGEEFDNGGVGWHFYFDEKAGASYMVNDDPESPYYKWYLSYESPLSLQAKLDFAHKYKMAGIIVWEVSQDEEGYPMIHQMSDNLIAK
ncbi:MAG: hypothetical protein IKB01_10560 [Lachnospiraceae bacterium]|nr:hypothetical protein [Lachnospiraceae bacterium]